MVKAISKLSLVLEVVLEVLSVILKLTTLMPERQGSYLSRLQGNHHLFSRKGNARPRRSRMKRRSQRAVWLELDPLETDAQELPYPFWCGWSESFDLALCPLVRFSWKGG